MKMTQEEFDRLQARNSKTPGRLVAPQCERPKVTACPLWQQEECGCTPVSGCQKLDADPVPIKPLPHVFRSGRSKYKNVKTGRYASKAEAARAAQLQALQAGGFISELAEQVRFLLIPAVKDAEGRCVERACHYVADWTYKDANGVFTVEDKKGHRTEVFKLKKKLMRFVHGITILES